MDDHMLMLSHSQGDPERGAAETAVKGRRRRRKSKGWGEAAMRKRKLSDEQVSMLEKCFGREHKLESERKDRLAAELGLDPRQVAVWFQNRRARWKSKKLEEEYNKLRSEHDSAVVEKCRLQSELIHMKERLDEASKKIEKLSFERYDGLNSTSPSSSISMDTYVAHHLGIQTYGDVFNYAEWDNDVYYFG